MKTDINCPYCNAELNINHDDGQGYKEDELHQQQCDYCDKNFVFTTSIIYRYSPEKADCLNDGKHDWKPTYTHPRYFTKMRCSMCDEERQPNYTEMKEFDIPLNPIF